MCVAGYIRWIISLVIPFFISIGIGCAANSAEDRLHGVITIQDSVQLREFSGLDVCSVSKLIAVRVDQPSISENRIDHSWVIIDQESGKVVLEADAGETINTYGGSESVRPQWSSDCKWIYYRAKSGDEVQVWRLNATSGAQEKVTSDNANILDFAITENRRTLVYKTSATRAAILSAEEREYQDGILIDENIFPWHRLVKTLPIAGRWATVRSWNARTVGHLLSREPPTFKTIVIEGRETRIATTAEISLLTEGRSESADWAPNPNAGLKISPAGDSVAVSIYGNNETAPSHKEYGTSVNRSKVRLANVHRKNSSDIHKCEDPRCIAKKLVVVGWSSDSLTIYFVAEHAKDTAGLYAWTPSDGIVRTIFQTEGVLGGFESPCTIIAEAALCVHADHGTPPSLLAIAIKNGSTETIFDPNSDLRARFNLDTERIRWKDKFGRDSLGVLVYPRDFKKGVRYPLIITTYTCSGFLSGEKTDGGPEYILAENGFLVLCIDFNWDLPPPETTTKYSLGPGRYVAALAEYESAIDMLAEKGLVDRARVGITGFSFSAQAISYALTRSNRLHVAALRSLGVLEPGHEMFFRRGMEITNIVYRDHNIGEDRYDAETVYKDISLSLRAEHITAPILVQASDAEYLGSLPVFAVLKKHDKPVEMYVFPDETHQLHQPRHQLVYLERNLDWFRFWLLGEEDQNPAKAEQYKRWRKLKSLQSKS